jgi:hypothetical protein
LRRARLRLIEPQRRMRTVCPASSRFFGWVRLPDPHLALRMTLDVEAARKRLEESGRRACRLRRR